MTDPIPTQAEVPLGETAPARTARAATLAAGLGFAGPSLALAGVLMSQLGAPPMSGFRLFLLGSLSGLSALAMVRVQRRAIGSTHDMMQAALNAQTAVERGLFLIANDPNWRTTYSSGVWLADKPLADGTYTLEGIDLDDGILSNDDTDPVILIGTGEVGDARHKSKVTLIADQSGLGCLETSLHANNDLIFNNVIVNGNQTVSANNNVAAGLSTVNPNVEAVNGITGDVYVGYQWAGVDPRSVSRLDRSP